jgi:predicted outer membrane repeat protein
MRGLALLFCFVAPLTSAASAAIYTVSPISTVGDFPNIQTAVDSVLDGDTILLLDGTFTGEGNRDIDFHGKAITVRSASGAPELCMIDCEGSEEDPHQGFLFVHGEGPSSVLEGVTVTGGYECNYMDYGGAVLILSSSPTINDCVFSGNSAFAGGAMACGEGSPTLTDCVFSLNTAETSGGAFHGGGESAPTFIGCTFSENTAMGGGGINM